MNKTLEQLERYRDESWKLDHDRAMECHAFEDWLEYGLALLGLIRRIDQRYRDRLRSGEATISHEFVESIQHLYETWYSPCGKLLEMLAQFEREGFAIANAQEFREACASTPIAGLEVERLNAAAGQFANSRGRKLGDVVDELRG